MENLEVNNKNWKSLIRPGKLDVKLSDDNASNACWIALNVPIPAGDAIELIQGKLVLEQDDSVYVASDTATSLDVVMSVLLDV